MGAGVIGLAVGRALARAGHETLIVEAANTFGTGVSSRNSEVIHAGIYYPQGSLKAELCVRGRGMLYAYCEQRDVRYRRCGKLIVATQPSERAQLEQIAHAAHRNGVDDLRMLEAHEALRLEPALRCVAALMSPSTGVIDSHGYMLSLLTDAENAGASLAVLSCIERLHLGARGAELYLQDEAQPVFRARWIIKCASLQAPALAIRMDGFPS